MSRIAVLSSQADIAASTVVLEQLAKRADVHVYTTGGAERIAGIRMKSVSKRNQRRLRRYDGVIAQIGGSGDDDWILAYAQDHPVVVAVLPDVEPPQLVAQVAPGRGARLEMAARNALAVVVHSRAPADDLRRRWSGVRVTIVPPAMSANPAMTADVCLRATLAPVGRPALQSELAERLDAVAADVAAAAGVSADELVGGLTRAARAIDLLE